MVTLNHFLVDKKAAFLLGDTKLTAIYCVVPENIHTPPTDGQWKFLGGGGAKR